ncbi:hypothetical protein QE152_g6807 [Popillia japonica]|uniref:Retroviral polymerase SH3-like domain-containing protein n=1 Tax=Popillia japonica TaxID=7064 RepID=A0AAW1MIS1_POPJA
MVHVPREKRKKWDPKSIEGVMVGYYEDSKAYRIYDPIEDAILKSRDVIFLESVTNDVQVTSEYNNSSNEFIIFTDDEQKLETVQENSQNLIEIESSEIQDNWATTDEEYKRVYYIHR